VTGQAPVAAIVQRVLPAPPAAVWEEWLDAEGMAEWMCPRPARPTKIELDPRPGGRLRIDIDDEGFELSVTGRYLELDEPRRLSFTWSCSNWQPPANSVVTVTLTPHGDEQTLMTIHHAKLPPDALDSNQNGWALISEQLESWLTRNPLHDT
jgi:uncharacterized protein YndB with AHSA1/START domain